MTRTEFSDLEVIVETPAHRTTDRPFGGLAARMNDRPASGFRIVDDAVSDPRSPADVMIDLPENILGTSDRIAHDPRPEIATPPPAAVDDSDRPSHIADDAAREGSASAVSNDRVQEFSNTELRNAAQKIW